MEEQTLYRKVHIHGEEDLPKEEGHYVVHDKQEDKVFQLGFFLEPKYDLPAIWMSIVDWYLLPVPLPSDKETELREALVAMVYQFAYRGTLNGIENIHTGGLSALEEAFEVLGLNDPQPVDVIIK